MCFSENPLSPLVNCLVMLNCKFPWVKISLSVLIYVRVSSRIRILCCLSSGLAHLWLNCMQMWTCKCIPRSASIAVTGSEAAVAQMILTSPFSPRLPFQKPWTRGTDSFSSRLWGCIRESCVYLFISPVRRLGVSFGSGAVLDQELDGCFDGRPGQTRPARHKLLSPMMSRGRKKLSSAVARRQMTPSRKL